MQNRRYSVYGAEVRPKKNVKPEKIVQLLLGLNDEETKTLRIKREGFLIEKKDGTILRSRNG